jgi:hypothetical protein
MSTETPQWFRELDAEDVQFLKRFLLASGSLKALAKEYGISYPTVRSRLDRLIGKVRAADESTESDPFQSKVRLLVADGKLAPEAARMLLDAHKKALGDMQKGDSHE